MTAMTNRRLDAIYFVLIVTVAGLGYFGSRVFSDSDKVLDVPSYSPTPIIFDVPFEPFELPFNFVKFKSAVPPKLALSNDMASVLVEVRSALLKSSTVVEVRGSSSMLAAVE